MDQADTLKRLAAYQAWNEADETFQKRCIKLVQNHHNFYDRKLQFGHLTGSAWIVNQDKNKSLLVHHKKLNRWLQPGGHTEAEDKNIFQAALREALEETGLKSIKALSEVIYDIDIHMIPAIGDMPAHEHFDIRYIFVADEQEILEVSEESNDLQWFSKEEIKEMTDEASILRMLEKM